MMLDGPAEENDEQTQLDIVALTTLLSLVK